MDVRPGLAVLLAGVLSILITPRPAAADPAVKARRIFKTVWTDPVTGVVPEARAAEISNVLFVNRCAGNCTVTPGNNDARYNTSQIVPSTSTITEFNLSDEVFNATMECLREVYSPYDVEIVTEDPGEEIFHHEAILAGSPEEIGQEPNVGGIASAGCTPLNNVISFSFANSTGVNLEGDELVETLCWTLAQESAHSFGLPNHVYDCLDPMTYLPGCGRKYFRDRGIECGEFEPKQCNCGGAAQNSHRELLNTFGAGTPPPPPEVSIVYPEADAAVNDNFSIFFTAVDPRLVERADVYLNGTKYLSLAGKDYPNQADPYSAEAPDFPDGYVDVEVRAYNEINEEAGVTVTRVLKGAPCTSADQCFEFMECNEGACRYPAASGELGDSCEYDQFCVTEKCFVPPGGDGVCSVGCDPGVTDACPEGLACAPEGFCYGGGTDEEGGCCTVAGARDRDDSFPLAVLSLFGAAVLLLRFRRR